MKPLAAVLALSLGAISAQAAAHGGPKACSFHSAFDLRIAPDTLTFARDDAASDRIVMRDGRLIVDGRELALSRADQARVRDYERHIRRLVPEVKAIAIDAVALASEAIIQVATSFSEARGSQTADKLRAISDRLVHRIEVADDTREFDDEAFEREIAAMTAEVVPTLVAEVAASAVAIALSGDTEAAQKLEQRAQRLERDLEQAIEQRARQLEQRADALCPRLAELDALEKELEARIDGAAIDLLQVR